MRLREQLRQDLLRARHRVTKLLLRHGRVWERAGNTWTYDHRRWIAAQQFEQADTATVLAELVANVDGLLARRAVLDERLGRIAQRPELWPTVGRLRCFRGIDTLTALALQLEIVDWQRFRPARLASWLGLVPSVEQSGETTTRGPITKTGSQHARRLLVEAAWHGRRPPRLGATLANRQLGQPGRGARRSPTARSSASTAPTSGCASVAGTRTSPPSPRHASWSASSGRPPRSNNRQRPTARAAAPAPGPRRHAR